MLIQKKPFEIGDDEDEPITIWAGEREVCASELFRKWKPQKYIDKNCSNIGNPSENGRAKPPAGLAGFTTQQPNSQRLGASALRRFA